MPKSEFTVILTTVDRQETADRIIDTLLQKKLVACIQLIPVKSCYIWQGSVNQDDERLMLIKARADRYPQIESAITAHHTYEVPEIIALPVTQGLPAYLSWINEVSQPEESE